MYSDELTYHGLVANWGDLSYWHLCNQIAIATEWYEMMCTEYSIQCHLPRLAMLLDIVYNVYAPSNHQDRMTHMHQWSRPSSAEIMACCLFGAEPSSEHTPTFCQLVSKEYISLQLETEDINFQPRKWIWKCTYSGGHFVSASICHIKGERKW